MDAALIETLNDSSRDKVLTPIFHAVANYYWLRATIPMQFALPFR